jgi:hypothetical protein
VSQLTYGPAGGWFSCGTTQEGTMKIKPRKLLAEYDSLIWSGVFYTIIGLWTLLFVIAVAHELFL